ncbi:hypothetical protein NA56DRAFT_650091 [Hyaloscypha hepaticicola]|uniref:Uncharacterized protein n=1 Tax=Hyaloscypha hepaticicola TaxID=2082293 RepID=A0A2J6PNM5_9HELO|nr:hypothetical protein NA56DRAFT_650091 [Hyaloscypha hepaticicola]
MTPTSHSHRNRKNCAALFITVPLLQVTSCVAVFMTKSVIGGISSIQTLTDAGAAERTL